MCYINHLSVLVILYFHLFYELNKINLHIIKKSALLKLSLNLLLLIIHFMNYLKLK